MEYITCRKCKDKLPSTKEYFWLDIRPGRGFRKQCKNCANAARRLVRKLNKATILQHTNSELCKILSTKLHNKELFETKRLQLYLKNLAEHPPAYTPQLTKEGIFCPKCKKTLNIILPINLLYLQEIIPDFITAHKHE